MASRENAIPSPDLGTGRAPVFEIGTAIAAELAIVASRAKRLLDATAALLGLILLSPLFLLVALAIRLDSHGSPFFRQERVGLHGRRFRVLKFRTMYNGTSEDRHRDYVRGLVNGQAEISNGDGIYKLVEDDRVTRLGRLLRRTSVDELPQLWNVLKGEMSLVGPRPPLPYEVQLYEEWQKMRLACRPGITGLWQVSGRNRLSYRQMCEIDIDYIRNWSFARDIEILLRTIPVVLTNSGRAH